MNRQFSHDAVSIEELAENLADDAPLTQRPYTVGAQLAKPHDRGIDRLGGADADDRLLDAAGRFSSCWIVGSLRSAASERDEGEVGLRDD